MNEVRWSDAALRKYIEEESHVSWFSDASDREAPRAQFRAQVRARVTPVVQARLLEKVGAVTDAEGITMVVVELAEELCCEDDARRWMLVCDAPWEYLTRWCVRRISRAYRSSVGKPAPTPKALAALAKRGE